MYSTCDTVPQDRARAARILEQAADQGFALAQVDLARICYNGEGIPEDRAKVVSLLQKAADQDDRKAQMMLGKMYHDGDGVPQDLVRAVELLQLAANQGCLGTSMPSMIIQRCHRIWLELQS